MCDPRPVPVSLEPDLLRAFVTVAELQSFTKAARSLHLTQSAISLQVKRLEDRTGAPLFDRTPQGAKLTDAGAALLPHARRILSVQEEALQSVRKSQEGRSVRFGMPDVFGMKLLRPVLASFREAFPEVTPEVRCDDSRRLLEELDEGRLDLALVVPPHGRGGGELVTQDPVAWVASPALRLLPDEPVPLVVFPDDCVFRTRAEEVLVTAGRPFRVVCVTQSTNAQELLIDEGYAVGLRGASTSPERWRQLGEAEGLPPMPEARIELHRAPGATGRLLDTLADALVDEGKARLGP